MCVRPPFIYVIPHELGEIVAIQIPKLRPQGTSYLPLRSPLTISNALNDHRVPDVLWSILNTIDQWQPPALRHGLVILITYTGVGEMHRIIQLPPLECPTTSPTSALQDPRYFYGVPLGSFKVVNDGKHGIAMGRNLQTADLAVSIRTLPFNANAHNFSAPISQSVPISGLGRDVWAETGSFCLASGTALLAGYNNTVAILYFD